MSSCQQLHDGQRCTNPDGPCRTKSIPSLAWKTSGGLHNPLARLFLTWTADSSLDENGISNRKIQKEATLFGLKLCLFWGKGDFCGGLWSFDAHCGTFATAVIVVAGPTDILSDSQSAVGMAFDPISFKNTKHIMRAAEFLRDLVLKGHVILKHVPGTLMIADLLTKAPARATFIELVKLLDDYSRTP